MTFEALGDLGDFVSGIGVVVTLVYLAVQVRGNTQALQSNTLQTLQSEANRMNLATASNPELARVLVKAENGLDHLSPVERCQEI
jgi:hypothetical protein